MRGLSAGRRLGRSDSRRGPLTLVAPLLDLSPRGGERWDGGRCREDRFPNAFDISQHVIIPKTHNAITMVDEPSIARDVAPAIGMLAAIELDDEPFLSTNKIYHVRADRLLTHKFKPGERTRPEMTPQLTFGERRFFFATL